MFDRSFLRPTEVGRIIGRIKEHGLPAIASLDNMIRDVWKINLPRFADCRLRIDSRVLPPFSSYFGMRASNVYDSYKEGNNWERDLFIESTSFAASSSAGSVVLDSGMAALGFLVMATPIGWVGLIVGGAVVVGAAAATGYETNKY